MEKGGRSKLDVGIAILALLGVVVFIYFLVESLNNVAPLRSGQARIVGDLIVIKPGVRVKTSEDYSWYPLRDNSSVYTGDTIFTGSDSEALIRLGSGLDEIRLEPFSLVTLSDREGLAEVTLHFGEFESSLEKGSLVVNADGERSTIEGQNANVKIRREPRKMSVEVLSGDAKLDGPGGLTQLRQNQRLSLNRPKLNAEPKARVEEDAPAVQFTIKPQAPEAPAALVSADVYKVPDLPEVEYSAGLYRVPPGGSLQLSWDAPKSYSSFDFVMAKDPEFKEILVKREFKNPQVSLSAVPQRKFYWRVRTKSPAGEVWSEYSDAARIEVHVPALTGKPSDPRFQIMDEDHADAMVQWKPFPGVKLFELEHRAVGDENWSALQLASPRAKIRGVRGSQHEWRVRAAGEDARPLGAFSESYFIDFNEDAFPSVVVPDVAAIDIPTLTPEEPAINQARALALSEPPILRGPAQQETFVSFGETPTYMVLDWKGNKEVSSYEVQLAADLDFKKVIIQATVFEPLYVFTGALCQGEYFWRVRSVIEEESSRWSRPKSVVIDNP